MWHFWKSHFLWYLWPYLGKCLSDGISRSSIESFCSETIPQMLLNCKDDGCWGGDLNCITKCQDCTHNSESKMSPCLRRLEKTFTLKDSYRALHPDSNVFSSYYTRGGAGEIGASRIDRCYHWGNIDVLEASYQSVAFSDHMQRCKKFPNLRT